MTNYIITTSSGVVCLLTNDLSKLKETIERLFEMAFKDSILDDIIDDLEELYVNGKHLKFQKNSDPNAGKKTKLDDKLLRENKKWEIFLSGTYVSIIENDQFVNPCDGSKFLTKQKLLDLFEQIK